MFRRYFKNLYRRAISSAYTHAQSEIVAALRDGGVCLDCGAHSGQKFQLLNDQIGLESQSYFGLEWNQELASRARQNGINVVQGDLNRKLEFQNDMFQCVFGLSVLEHLLNPCLYLRESFRCLKKGGTLVLLTPNISTYFTAALILAGKMPSSGPHPDSDALLKQEELFKVSQDSIQPDSETDTPVHRHLVVFSYRVLGSYLSMVGFSNVRGYGFGLYPFPNFTQAILEKVDPYHCHQMVFIARK